MSCTRTHEMGVGRLIEGAGGVNGGDPEVVEEFEGEEEVTAGCSAVQPRRHGRHPRGEFLTPHVFHT